MFAHGALNSDWTIFKAGETKPAMQSKGQDKLFLLRKVHNKGAAAEYYHPVTGGELAAQLGNVDIRGVQRC